MTPTKETAVRAHADAASKLEGGTRAEAATPAPTEPAAAPEIPDVVVERALGRGGMGTVFRGHSISLDRPIAIKVIHPELARSESFVQRFEREARALAKLSHANIVTCFNTGQARGGERYLVMELVEGRDLLAWVRERGVFAERDALALGRQLADALAYALDRGVIHRDVKPENVLVETTSVRGSVRGSALRVKLVDLGLASFRGSGDVRITQTGTILGSPLTMAPEQAEAPESVDHRSDIYALGATLYFAVTGHFPHEGATPGQVLSRKLRGVVVPPRQISSRLSPATSELLLWMLRPDMTERPRTYEELIEAFDAILEGRAASIARRRGIGKRVLVLALVVGVIALGASGLLAAKRLWWNAGSANGPAADRRPPEPVAAAASSSRGSVPGPTPSPAPPVAPAPAAPTAAPPTPAAVPSSATTQPVIVTVSPEPPSLPWGPLRTILPGPGSLFGGWERAPRASSFQIAEEEGACDGVAEGANEVALLTLESLPAAPWRLRGAVVVRSALDVGVRLGFSDRTLDVSVQHLNGGTYMLKLSRTDEGRRDRLALLVLVDRPGVRRELTLVHTGDALWARLDGGPSAEGRIWAVARTDGPARSLGLFVKKGAASFDAFTLETPAAESPSPPK